MRRNACSLCQHQFMTDSHDAVNHWRHAAAAGTLDATHTQDTHTHTPTIIVVAATCMQACLRQPLSGACTVLCCCWPSDNLLKGQQPCALDATQRRSACLNQLTERACLLATQHTHTHTQHFHMHLLHLHTRSWGSCRDSSPDKLHARGCSEPTTADAIGFVSTPTS
jgi:hypothetical protein